MHKRIRSSRVVSALAVLAAVPLGLALLPLTSAVAAPTAAPRAEALSAPSEEIPTNKATDPESAAAGIGTKHVVYVAVVSYPGMQNPDAGKLDDVKRRFEEAARYWENNSSGAVSSMTVVEPVAYTTSETPLGGGNTFGCEKATQPNWDLLSAEAAQRIGSSRGAEDAGLSQHIAIDLPCSYAGLGSIGNVRSESERIWVGYEVVPHIIAHELGHNLGLLHANSQVCEGVGDECSRNEYGDLYSVMGANLQDKVPALNGSFLKEMGWMPAGQDLLVPADGKTHRVALQSVGSLGSNGPRFATLTDPATQQQYLLEYRDGTGADAGAGYVPGSSQTELSTNKIRGWEWKGRPLTAGLGVKVTRLNATRESDTILNGSDPATYGFVFGAGQRFTNRDGAGQVAFTVVSLSNGEAVLDVRSGGDAQVAAPTLTVTQNATCADLRTLVQYDGPRENVTLHAGGVSVDAATLSNEPFDVSKIVGSNDVKATTVSATWTDPLNAQSTKDLGAFALTGLAAEGPAGCASATPAPESSGGATTSPAVEKTPDSSASTPVAAGSSLAITGAAVVIPVLLTLAAALAIVLAFLIMTIKRRATFGQ